MGQSMIETPGFVVRYRTRDFLVAPDRFLRIRVDEGDVHPAYVWVTDATLFATREAAAVYADLFRSFAADWHDAEVARAVERTAVELAGGQR